VADRQRVITIVAVNALMLAGCAVQRGDGEYVAPGPTGPSPVATMMPYVWDSRDELTVRSTMLLSVL